MGYENDNAPEGTLASDEIVKVIKVEYKDGRVEHPYDEELRKKIVIGSDGKPRSPYWETRAFWASEKGMASVKKAIEEGKAFPAD
jgi:hypothetical protein